MTKTNKERVLDFLWSVGPQGATNSQIREATTINSHQQVYMITQELVGRGLLTKYRQGHEWIFIANEADNALFSSPGQMRTAKLSDSPKILIHQEFEALARQVMEQHFAVSLQEATVPGVAKRFDMVSADFEIIGDAKYYTMVGGKALPPAKFATIAEHVWLLEKTNAKQRFLVFGNDIEVPVRWLERYGELVEDVMFFFLCDSGELIRL